MKGKCFSRALFHATMDGRKTQFREVIKPQPDERGLRTTNVPFEDWHGREVKPRYKAGETVYLKEPYFDCRGHKGLYRDLYRYSGDELPYVGAKWQNSLFMPESAARYFIKITGVRAQKVQDIKEDDCFTEGISIGRCGNKSNWMKAYYFPGNNQPYVTASSAYEELFDKINGKGEWKSNPWVWVYECEILE